MVPSLEVWNEGVWMELGTLWDDPLMGEYLSPGEEKTYLRTKSIARGVPYPAPGIYRIVVYGAYDDAESYAATESFVIE